MNMKAKQMYVAAYNFRFCNLFTKYHITGKIGKGTYGEVFKAISKENPSEFVAMKKILMNKQTQGFPMTALREIQILQSLKHDNIVRFIEVCRSKSVQSNQCIPSYFVILEFCEHDLEGILANLNVQFTLNQIKGMMRQLFVALYYIHSNKILHRDLKSANVLVTKKGVLKLADFGLSRTFSIKSDGQPNRYTNEVATLWYRPPELLLGDRNYGTPMDLWAAGCIMAEMWWRRPIMCGNSEQKQLSLITRLCGSISPEVWPGVEQLPLYNKLELMKGTERKVVKSLRQHVNDKFALDLLDKLLVLDPSKRIDSDKALKHDFFLTDPMPCDLSSMLSKYDNNMFNFYTRKKHSKNKEQQTPPQEPPRQELPREEPPRQELPREESPRQELPREEPLRQEPPREEPLRQETPREEELQEESQEESSEEESPQQDSLIDTIIYKPEPMAEIFLSAADLEYSYRAY